MGLEKAYENYLKLQKGTLKAYWSVDAIGNILTGEGINFERIQDGGHQEKGKRSGTENVAGIVGLSEAIKYSYKEFDYNNAKVLNLRNYFINKLKENFKGIKINGDLEKRLPGNINVSFPNVDGGELLLQLDEYGICASAGSACSTGSSNPSHVLTSIGLSKEESAGTLRFTLGKENTKQEIDFVINVIRKIVI